LRRTARTSAERPRARWDSGRRDPFPAAALFRDPFPAAALLRDPFPAAALFRGPFPAAALLMAAALFMAACGGGNPTPIDGSLPAAPAAEEMRATLVESADAWNRRDLDGFMEPYLRSPDLTFSGSGGVRRGFDSVVERYRASYFQAEAPLPSLRFEDLETRDLGRDHALMLGRYILLDPTTGEQMDTGFFTLVWVRTRAGWRILHDHTSAAAP